jgi:hypothetical protein
MNLELLHSFFTVITSSAVKFLCTYLFCNLHIDTVAEEYDMTFSYFKGF